MEGRDRTVDAIEDGNEGGEIHSQTALEVSIEDSADGSGSDSAAVAVLRAVSRARGKDPLELDPLEPAINTDALDQIVAAWMERGESNAAVTFEYSQCSITVHGRGVIEVTDQQDPADGAAE